MLNRSSPGVIHCRRSALELGSFFFEPVQLHVQLANLPVQLLDHHLMIVCRFAISGQRAGRFDGAIGESAGGSGDRFHMVCLAPRNMI